MESEWQRQLGRGNGASNKATHSYRLKFEKAFVFLRAVVEDWITSFQRLCQTGTLAQMCGMYISYLSSSKVFWKDVSSCLDARSNTVAMNEWVKELKRKAIYLEYTGYFYLIHEWLQAEYLVRSEPVVTASKEEGAYREIVQRKGRQGNEYDKLSELNSPRCWKEMNDRLVSRNDVNGSVPSTDRCDAVTLPIHCMYLYMYNTIQVQIEFRQALMREGIVQTDN